MIEAMTAGVNVPTIAPMAPVAQAARAPFAAIQHRLDAHVWNAVARDASNPAAQQVAMTVLAAMQGGTVPPQAIAGATTLAPGVVPGAPVAMLPSVGVPAVQPAAGPAAAAPAATASPQATEVVRLVNEARAAKGLAPLTLDPKLVQVAAAHSQQMASQQKMAHEGIGNGTPRERILKASPKAARTAENVALGQQTAAEVHQGWMDSAGHRRNVLDPKLTRIGVEVVTGADGRPYWTQVFTG